MTKKLICTRADSGISEMIAITHPIIKRYAEKCDADFKVLENRGEIHPHYRILQLYDLFEKYDRILILDSDILIMKNCPNVFDIVHKGMIGSIYEDKGSRQEHRRNLIREIQKERGSVNWTEGYINSGFAIFSREHREVFNVDKDNLWMNFGLDDVEIMYQIKLLGFKVHELSYKWNLMSMFLEPWSGMSKGNAYVLHYAGNGLNSGIERTKQIRQDYLILKRYNMIEELI